MSRNCNRLDVGTRYVELFTKTYLVKSIKEDTYIDNGGIL